MFYIMIMSGKGGVGKTFTAVNCARCMREMNEERVGLLDIDTTTPNLLEELPEPEKRSKIDPEKEKLVPAIVDGIEVVSHGLDLPYGLAMRRDAGFRVNIIKDYMYGSLWTCEDMFIDVPPGNVDEVYSILDLLSNKKSGAIIVSTGNKTSLIDAERSIDLVADTSDTIPIGIVLNMTEYKYKDKSLPLFNEKKPENIRGIPVVAEIPFFLEGPPIELYRPVIDRINEIKRKFLSPTPKPASVDYSRNRELRLNKK